MWLTFYTFTALVGMPSDHQTTSKASRNHQVPSRPVVCLMPKMSVSRNSVTVYRPCTKKCPSHNQCAAGTTVLRNVICEARVTPTNFD